MILYFILRHAGCAAEDKLPTLIHGIRRFLLTSVCRNISTLFKLFLFEGTYQLLFGSSTYCALDGLGLSIS